LSVEQPEEASRNSRAELHCPFLMFHCLPRLMDALAGQRGHLRLLLPVPTRPVASAQRQRWANSLERMRVSQAVRLQRGSSCVQKGISMRPAPSSSPRGLCSFACVIRQERGDRGFAGRSIVRRGKMRCRARGNALLIARLGIKEGRPAGACSLRSSTGSADRGGSGVRGRGREGEGEGEVRTVAKAMGLTESWLWLLRLLHILGLALGYFLFRTHDYSYTGVQKSVQIDICWSLVGRRAVSGGIV